MKVVFDESGFWWTWFLMNVVFDERGFWWTWFLMNVVFDESGFDESGFWWKWFLMKVVFDEIDNFHPNFDESVPKRCPRRSNPATTPLSRPNFEDFHLHDAEIRGTMTPSAEHSLHHCSLRREKNQRAVDKLTTRLTKVCRPVSRRLSVIERGDPLWNSLTHKFQTSQKFRATAQKVSKSGFFWNDKESRFSLTVKRRFDNTSFQADCDRRSIQKLNEMIESQKGEIYCAHQGDERLRRDQQLHHEQLLDQNGDLREARMKSLNEMEELKRFQGSTFDTISRRRLIEDRDTILELTAKIQELQNEVHCMNDSRNFNNPTLPDNQRFSYFFRDPGGMLSSSLGMPSRNDRPPSIWDTHGISGNVFAHPTASSSAPYPQESNPWISNVSEHTSPHVTSERQTPDTTLDPRCQSGPSARNSFDPNEGRFPKDYGADQQRLQISDLHVEKFLTPATFACWKIQDWGVHMLPNSYESYADIQEFDSKWDEILLSTTQIQSDDILEGLYKLRIRESEKLKTVLEL